MSNDAARFGDEDADQTLRLLYLDGFESVSRELHGRPSTEGELLSALARYPEWLRAVSARSEGDTQIATKDRPR